MPSLLTVLDTFRSARSVDRAFGGRKVGIEPSPARVLDRDALKAQLERVEKSNRVYFQLCFGAVAVLLLVSLYIIFLNMNSHLTLKVFLTFIEGCVAVLIGCMMRLWREKNNTELLLSLALYTEGDALQKVIDILADGLVETRPKREKRHTSSAMNDTLSS